MRLLTRRYTWAGWQFGVLKISMIALGVLLGVYFVGFWRPLLAAVWIVFLVTALWGSILAFRERS